MVYFYLWMHWPTTTCCGSSTSVTTLLLQTWDGWRHFLCNRSSIIDTYHSNHTLEEVGYYDDIALQLGVLGDGVELLLEINKNYTVSQAARFKIIIMNFSGSVVNLQPFHAMHPSILPFAMAWMAKGEFSGGIVVSVELEYSLFYQFIRSMPTLLER